MILTPRVLLVAIATGMFWLLALLAALFLVAGFARGHVPLLSIGAAGAALCIAIRIWFARKQQSLREWAQQRQS